MSDSVATREMLITAAIDRIETVGFNGFSFRDLASELGIAGPSVHYHFPTKADLGVAVIARLKTEGIAAYADLEQRFPQIGARWRARFAHLCDLAKRPERMCAFGSLLSDYGQVPEPMQVALAEGEAWLRATHTRWLDEGRRRGELSFPGSPEAMAGLIACVLHGLLMHHRAQRSLPVEPVTEQLLRLINA